MPKAEHSISEPLFAELASMVTQLAATVRA